MNRETYWLVASTVLSHVAATWSIGKRSSTSGSTGFCWLQAKLAGGSSRLTSSAQTTQRTITGPFSLLLCCETATRWSRQNWTASAVSPLLGQSSLWHGTGFQPGVNQLAQLHSNSRPIEIEIKTTTSKKNIDTVNQHLPLRACPIIKKRGALSSRAK